MARPWNQRHRCMTSLVLLWGLWASTVAAATWQATTDSLSTGVDTDLVLTLEGTQTDGGTTSPISKGDAVPNITATLYGSGGGAVGQLQQLDGTPIVSAGTRVTDAQWRLRFVPPNGGAGRYTFEFNLVPSPGNSGQAPSSVASVSIDVLAQNVAPVAQDLSLSGNEDGPISVSLTATDATHSPSDLTFRVSQVIRDNVGVLHQFDAGAPDNVGDAVAVGELLATDQLVFLPFTDVVGTFGGIYAYEAIDPEGAVSNEATVSFAIAIDVNDDPPEQISPAKTFMTSDEATVTLVGRSRDMNELYFEFTPLVIQSSLLQYKGYVRGVCEDVPCVITAAHLNAQNLVEVVPSQPCKTVLVSAGKIPDYSVERIECSSTVVAQSRGQGAGLAAPALHYFNTRTVDVGNQRESPWRTVEFETSCVPSDGLVANTWSEGSLCVPCPFGGTCIGTGLPAAASGYWLLPGTNATFLSCNPAEACPGGATSQCKPGYKGRACGNCDVGYYRSSSRCLECPSTSFATTVGVVAALVLAVVAVVALAWRFAQARGSKAWVSIGLNFFQVIAVLAEFDLSWPTEVKNVTDWVSLFNFNMDLAAPECEIPEIDYITKLKIYLAIPVALVVALLIAATAVTVFASVKARVFGVKATPNTLATAQHGGSHRGSQPTAASQPAPETRLAPNVSFSGVAKLKTQARKLRDFSVKALWRRSSNSEKFLVASLTLLKLYYLAISAQVFGFFDCTVQADGQSTLDPDPSLSCDDAWWYNWQGIMIGALVVYVVGIPFSYCVMLGVSPGAGFLHILVTAHDGLYTIAELFEVALVGPPPEATPSEDDDLFRGSKLPPPARSHSVFVTLILAVLLLPYCAWGLFVVEPFLFLYGLFVFAVARPVYALSKATGFAHFMPTSTATDFASRLARQRGCCCGVFRRAALARIGRIGIWLPVPGMAGDPALTEAQREAQPQARRVSPSHSPTGRHAHGSLSDVRGGDGGAKATSAGARAALRATESGGHITEETRHTQQPVSQGMTINIPPLHGEATGRRVSINVPTSPRVFRNSFMATGSFQLGRHGSMRSMARTEANVAAAPTLVVQTTNRMDGKLPFVASVLSRDYRREMYYFELFILGRKLLLLFPRVFFSNYPAMQATLTVIVLLAALSLQLHFKPYRSDALNWLEFTGLLIASWVLLAGLLFNAGDFPRASMRTVVSKLVVFAILAAMVYMAFALLWAAVSEFSKRLRNLDDVNLPPGPKKRQASLVQTYSASHLHDNEGYNHGAHGHRTASGSHQTPVVSLSGGLGGSESSLARRMGSHPSMRPLGSDGQLRAGHHVPRLSPAVEVDSLNGSAHFARTIVGQSELSGIGSAELDAIIANETVPGEVTPAESPSHAAKTSPAHAREPGTSRQVSREGSGDGGSQETGQQDAPNVPRDLSRELSRE